MSVCNHGAAILRDTGVRRLEHYCIAFFDVLRYDGKELLSSPYTLRRQLLEKIVIPIEGYVCSAGANRLDGADRF